MNIGDFGNVVSTILNEYESNGQGRVFCLKAEVGYYFLKFY